MLLSLASSLCEYESSDVDRLANLNFIILCCFLHRKFISIQILEEDSYEKDVLFYVNLKTPRLIEGKFLLDLTLFF